MTIIYTDPQGSDAWLAVRRGVITASRFKDTRDRLKSGAPSKACLGYAMDLARERCGGSVLPTFATAAMRLGSEQEKFARVAYEAATGAFVNEAGFICTDDMKFGVSVDGLPDPGVWECKTMVSSDTLFTALVDGDVSAYRDQCIGALWLLRRPWIDLSLWCADLQILHTIRIERDEAEIQALEDDLIAFDKMVSVYEAKLLGCIDRAATPSASPRDGAGRPDAIQPLTRSAAPADLPADIFA